VTTAKTKNAFTKDTARALLRSHPILAGVDEEGIEAIVAAAVIKHYRANEVLTREGDPAWAYWFLVVGHTRVYYSSPEGLTVTVKLFAAPAAWAEMQVLHAWVHTENCVAEDDVVCVCLPKLDFERLLLASPRFMKNVLVDAGARFLITAQHERALAFLKVPQRLAYLLLSYVRLHGEDSDDGVLIRHRLSQDELANGLGVARKSVMRAFAAWIEAGVLIKRGAYYVVVDMERLRDEAPHDVLGIDWVAGGRLAEGIGNRRRRR
jgi:CRP/FNR family cyclic AMP-dependent transcriptional regulator